jgi:two-component system, NarL family, response regulator LiaR
MAVIRIVLVDDHRVVTTSLKAYLESFPDVRVVGMATSGEELLAHVEEWTPDVILQDLLLPGGIDGVETTRRVLAKGLPLRVIALTASMDEARMMGVLRAGAVGYVRKDAEPETLLAAVRAVAAGRTYIDPAVSRQLVEARLPIPRRPGERGKRGPTTSGNLKVTPTIEELTPRERDVLRQLALGRSNREIAAALDIGDETVKTHVARVLAKLDVENRAQAIVQALKRGLVGLGELEQDCDL